MYPLIKHIHMITVVVSLLLFIWRAGLHWQRPQQAYAKWLRIVPHINDTLLLISAISLAVLLQQYPLAHAWLTTKVVLLLVYIGLGTVALKKAHTRPAIALTSGAAVLCFGYIMAVAISKSPLPF
ncbi:SirB2 family protein [Pontibacter sp. JAM-7]|uniref:SirB2 family protein n=1 Tax=Pontibacter sp. JAM-7 TaxID=3366581 RepID=UPI003AF51AD9